MPNLNFRKENALGNLITKWATSNYRAYDFCTLVCQDHAKKLPIQALDTIVYCHNSPSQIKKFNDDKCCVSGCINQAEFMYHFNE